MKVNYFINIQCQIGLLNFIVLRTKCLSFAIKGECLRVIIPRFLKFLSVVKLVFWFSFAFNIFIVFFVVKCEICCLLKVQMILFIFSFFAENKRNYSIVSVKEVC